MAIRSLGPPQGVGPRQRTVPISSSIKSPTEAWQSPSSLRPRNKHPGGWMGRNYSDCTLDWRWYRKWPLTDRPDDKLFPDSVSVSFAQPHSQVPTTQWRYAYSWSASSLSIWPLIAVMTRWSDSGMREERAWEIICQEIIIVKRSVPRNSAQCFALSAYPPPRSESAYRQHPHPKVSPQRQPFRRCHHPHSLEWYPSNLKGIVCVI